MDLAACDSPASFGPVKAAVQIFTQCSRLRERPQCSREAEPCGPPYHGFDAEAERLHLSTGPSGVREHGAGEAESGAVHCPPAAQAARVPVCNRSLPEDGPARR